MQILNLTQHDPTPEQIEAGVVNLPESDWSRVKGLLTVPAIPSRDELVMRTMDIALIAVAHGAERAMIGGAPFLMSGLELALASRGIEAVYAFSQRKSVDVPQPDGSVRKVAVFQHLGFVPAGGTV